MNKEYQNFSINAFDKNTLNNESKDAIREKLATKIQQEIHQVVLQKFQNIVENLNFMGHNLHPDGEQEICDLSYRDDWENASYNCKLRVSFVGVVSVSYVNSSHTLQEIEYPE
ncbi:hypothetical protein BCD64_24070 [Nostoc sp. MBR 210]|nr:hypothetical protein BCD64_24070 [Nostoc sp. MBR 210]